MTKEEVLQILRESQDHVSGEQLAGALNVTRSAVWKQIRALTKDGYVIDSQQNKGYKLISTPDLLYPSEVKNGLQTKLIGNKVIHFSLTTSTNNVARQLAEKGVDEGAVVIAEAQTKGKGRRGRKFVANKGGVWMSLILRPRIDPMHASNITIMAAVSVTKALRSLGVEAVIKWPNDVLVNGKKICGILTEMTAETDVVNFIILGIGINVNNDIPLETATSVRVELGRDADRLKFLQSLLEELESDYLTLKDEGFDPILWNWRRYSDTLGRPVEVTYQDEVIKGMAQDVSEDGSLIVKQQDGSVKKIVSGDCKHLRSIK